MEVKRQTSLKVNNANLLLSELYKKRSATMAELIQATGLSQSSVRNMLRQFEEGVITELGVDQSTGGRKPNRFALTASYFSMLCLYAHATQVEYQIVLLDQVVQSGTFHFSNQEDLIIKIQTIVETKQIRHVSIGVEGVVKGDVYYTDHDNVYTQNDWVKAFKQQSCTSVRLVNDVKLMLLGISTQEAQPSHVSFLYVNHLGMACATMKDGRLMDGHKGIMGELGLLPYHGVSINQAIRDCKTKETFESLLLHLLSILCVSMDPESIMISHTYPYQLQANQLQTTLETMVHESYPIQMISNANQCLFQGLQAVGIQELLMEVSKRASRK